MVNTAILIGRLTANPELQYTKAGSAVCNFDIAVNREYNKDEVDFIKIVTWSKLAELCADYLSKGRLIYVQGRIQTRSYTDREGVRRRAFEVVANTVKFLDKPKGLGEGSGEGRGEGRGEGKYRRRDNTGYEEEDWESLGREVDISDIEITDDVIDDEIPF